MLHFKLVVHAWFPQFLLGCNTAATAIFEKCIAYAQAEGRTRPTIDTKVCNKKVAVDDVGPLMHARGDQRPGRQVPAAEPQRWSCVDYVGVERPKDKIPTQESPARVPAGDKHLSTRFGGLAGHDERRGDSHGSCKGYNDSGKELNRGCVEVSMEIGGPGIGVGMSSGRTYKQWVGKQTNRGWPGTAEGKINTAQGMAGDLVSNLNREEKNAVAGILSKTISGA